MVKVVSVSMGDLCSTVGRDQLADGWWEHTEPISRPAQHSVTVDYESQVIDLEDFGHICDDFDLL